MHGWSGYGYGSQMGAFGWIGPIMMVLFWALILFGIVVLIRYLLVQTRRQQGGTGTGPAARSGKDALAILRERYARGEIDTAEFAEKKRILSEDFPDS
jgi:putative membrane protein